MYSGIKLLLMFGFLSLALKLSSLPELKKISLQLFQFDKNLVQNKTHPQNILEIYSIIILITHFYCSVLHYSWKLKHLNINMLFQFYI